MMLTICNFFFNSFNLEEWVGCVEERCHVLNQKLMVNSIGFLGLFAGVVIDEKSLCQFDKP